MQTALRTYQNGTFTSALTSQKSVSNPRISYVYGYQSSECDPELKGEGNSYTTYFRQLDPRIGRWLTLDPVVHASQSPYCSMDNNPIWHNDPKGDDVGYGSKKDERRVRRQAFFNKEFRALHQSRIDSDELFIYKQADNKPRLKDAESKFMWINDFDQVENWVEYSKFGFGGGGKPFPSPFPGPVPPPHDWNFPKIEIKAQYGTKTVTEKTTIETPIPEKGTNPIYGPLTFKSPEDWVPNTPVEFRAASQPDIFNFRDQNGNNIVPQFAIVQGSTQFRGVTTTSNAWLSVPTNSTITAWTVSVTTAHYWQKIDASGNNAGVQGFPSSTFYIRYQKNRFFPNKISITIGK